VKVRVPADRGVPAPPVPAARRAAADPTSVVLALQHHAGNAAVARMTAAGALQATRRLSRDDGGTGSGTVTPPPPSPGPAPTPGPAPGPTTTTTPPPGPAAPPSAIDTFRQELAAGHWEAAALALNSASAAEIDTEVKTLTAQQCRQLLAAVRLSRRITAANNIEAKLKQQGHIGPGAIFGTVNVEQHPTHAPHDGDNYQFETWIQFTPDATVVDCNDIAVIQAVRLINTGTGANAEVLQHLIRRQTPHHWAIDRIEDRRFGFYGFENTGVGSGDPGTQGHAGPGGNMRVGSTATTPVTPMHYYDGPTDSMVGVTFEFETAIVARSGPQQGTVYATVTWGFSVDAHGHLTAQAVGRHDRVSGEFRAARNAWDAQAAGPAAQRNDPHQSQLIDVQ
jgi:hypothetical protein